MNIIFVLRIKSLSYVKSNMYESFENWRLICLTIKKQTSFVEISKWNIDIVN